MSNEIQLPLDGFLSPKLEPWRDAARASAHEWFNLVDGINRSAVAILSTLEPQRSSAREMMAAQLFARALQTFEAAILLAERGMLADAGTLARSIVETTIYLGGVATKENFTARMAADNNHHFHEMGVAIAEHLERDGGEDGKSEAKELRKALEAAKGGDFKFGDIKLRNLAKEVGMDPLYEVVYRQPSGDSAHPSIASCERHLVRDARKRVEKLIFKPQRDGLERTLSSAIVPLLGAMEALSHVFARSDIAGTVDTYNAHHQRLGRSLEN